MSTLRNKACATRPSQNAPGVTQRDIVYVAGTLDKNGKFTKNDDLSITLTEKLTGGNSNPVICTAGCTEKHGLEDQIAVKNPKSWFTVEQKFSVSGKGVKTGDVKVARKESDGKVTLASKQIVRATATEITVTPQP